MFIRTQVALHKVTGNPDDDVVNVFHFDSATTSSKDNVHTAIATALDSAYTAIGLNMSSTLSGTGTIKSYDLSDPLPRLPFGESDFTFPVSSSTNVLPDEVAICVSYRGATISGVNMKRRRGRLYLGPWAMTAASVVSNECRPSITVRNTLDDFVLAIAGGVSPLNVDAIMWAVHSPTTLRLGGTLDESFEDVVFAYVDDAFDTQRRRGVAPITRTTLYTA